MSTKLPYFGRNFNASFCPGRDKSAQRVSSRWHTLMFSDFFVHNFESQAALVLFIAGYLLKYCYDLEKASREIDKK